MGRSLDYGFLNEARNMPPRRHANSELFDIMQSDVAAWLVQLPEVRQKVFYMAAHKGLIVFNGSTGLWEGVDWR